MNAAPFVPTARLKLRAFTMADEADIVAMHRDPRVRELLVDDVALEQPALARELITRVAQVQTLRPGLGIWHASRQVEPDAQSLLEARAAVEQGELEPAALHWLQTPRWVFCGWFNLMPMAEDPSRVEIGSRLLPAHWGGGLVLDGGEALLDHAFGLLQLPEVWGLCHPAHRSVHAVLHTLGFEARSERVHSGVLAAEFCLAASRWAEVRTQPRRERQRRALQQLACAPIQLARGRSSLAHGAATR
jgi:RimJ/RimL family protein N-acetyltransferase